MNNQLKQHHADSILLPDSRRRVRRLMVWQYVASWLLGLMVGSGAFLCLT